MMEENTGGRNGEVEQSCGADTSGPKRDPLNRLVPGIASWRAHGKKAAGAALQVVAVNPVFRPVVNLRERGDGWNRRSCVSG